MRTSAPRLPDHERPQLDVVHGFRAYAIVGVVVIHLLGMSGVMAASRGTALGAVIGAVLGNVIDAFFIITGFLLFLPTVLRGGSFGSVREYAIGRATRLLPAYWVCLALLIALAAVAPLAPATGPPSLASVGLHAAPLQMPAKLFDPTLAIGFGLDGPVWMISVVAGFYVVLPFVASRYLRRPLVGLAVAALLSVAWELAVVHFDGLFLALAEGAVPRTSSASWPPTSSRAGRSRSRSG